MALKSAVSTSNLIHKFKALLPNFLITYIPWLCIFVIVRLQTRIPIRHLTRDALAIVDEPFYFGMLSQIGCLFWCACAAICFFVAAVIEKKEQSKLILFYLYSGALTTVLLLDDIFLIHEVVFPIYLNISEKVVYLVYLILLSLYLLKFQKTIRNTEFLPLLLAFIFFGFSVSIDKGLIPIPQAWLENEGNIMLEDGAKLLGIVSWFTYFTKVCVNQIKQAI